MDKNNNNYEQIERNRKIHDKLYRKYEKRHPDQFLPIEQARIKKDLTEAIHAIRTGTKKPLVLDYGCGVGNFTRHFLALGVKVVAADVSENFLSLIKERYPNSSWQFFLCHINE